MPRKSQKNQSRAPWTATVDKASRSPVPIELYRDIVSHVKRRRDIFTLLTVSKAFKYEAERIIYRDLTLVSQFSIAQFMNRLSIGHHVHTLHISFIQCATPPIDLLPVLRSMINLKELDIRLQSPSTQYIPDEVPFQLHKLTTTYRGDPHFEKFLKSQKELKTLEWRTTRINHISKDLNLPVTTLISYSPTVLSMILPSQKVERIQYMSIKDLLLIGLDQILSVRSISVDVLHNLERMAYCFPNVRFLSGRYRQEASLFPGIGRFKRLEKLHLHQNSSLEGCGDLVARLFNQLEACSTIEMTGESDAQWGVPPRMFKRGSQDLNGVEVWNADIHDEWLKW